MFSPNHKIMVLPMRSVRYICSLISFALFLLACSKACAQSEPKANAQGLLDRIRSAVVKIRVVGYVQGKQTTESGTGFVIQTTKGLRVVTAGHVIGRNDKWDDVTTRLIYIKWAAYGSAIEPEPVIEAEVQDSPDLAQVYLDPFPISPLSFARPVPLASSNTLYVVSWPRSERKAQIQDAIAISEADRLVLSGDYDPSDSGSPVLNSQGELVAMLIERSKLNDGSTRGLALPIYLTLLIPPSQGPLTARDFPRFPDYTKYAYIYPK